MEVAAKEHIDSLTRQKSRVVTSSQAEGSMSTENSTKYSGPSNSSP